jgi:2-aminoethylphosphonate transport system ATP-binding protein
MAHAFANSGGADPAPPAIDAGRQVAGNGIVFEGVSVAYKGLTVLDQLSLKIEPGEFVALIGPSGSGKTTALRAVAGFVRPVAGTIRIGDVDVTHLPPYERGIGMVVQNYALFPHMPVHENVAFGLHAQSAAKELIGERVRESLRMVGMHDYITRYPRELSGGQQQRVAIARALAIRPKVLLLDEPLSALDAQIRRNMVEELGKLHRDLPSLTVLYVTHDQTEALTLADRIAIMRGGRLSALGASSELYRQPPNRFAAEFLGRANLLPVVIEAIDPVNRQARLRFGKRILAARHNPDLGAGQACLLCIRPHDMQLGAHVDAANFLEATVTSAQWQGDSQSIVAQAQGHELRVISAPLDDMPQHGAKLALRFAPERASLIAEDAAPGGKPQTGVTHVDA